jgi:CheY-like chemotaxis protein
VYARGVRQRRGVVLLVEDDDDFRDAMVDALHQCGFAALAARNGSEALRTFDAMLAAVPDVIVLDLEMPVMDGYAFLAARTERPEIASVPVIVMSGAPPDRELASSVLNEYLPKPVPIAALIDAIVRCTSLHRKHAAH